MDPASASARDQFGRWLRHGRGLALLRAGQASGAEYEETLLDACTHFTGNDFQSEGSRAEYLFDVLVAAGARDRLEAWILSALEHREGWDLEQLLDLAYLFALDGSPAAEQALRDTFLRHVEESERPGSAQVVCALGLPGMVLVARELGRVLPESGADWSEVHPLEVAESHLGVEEVFAALTLAAGSDPQVRRYLEAVRAYRSSGRTFRVPSEGEPAPPLRPLPFALTFEALRAAILEASKPPARFQLRRWGREAPVEELVRAAEALNAGAPPVLRLAILGAFADRPFPGPVSALLDVLSSGNEEEVTAAWSAMQHLDAPEIRVHAREELGKSPPNLEALRGLQQDLRSEDVPLVAGALAATTDPEEHHLAGLILQDAAETRGGTHLVPLLLTAYEQGTCGICREAIVLHMVKLGVASRPIIEECRYDAFLDLRAGAAGWLARHPEPAAPRAGPL